MQKKRFHQKVERLTEPQLQVLLSRLRQTQATTPGEFKFRVDTLERSGASDEQIVEYVKFLLRDMGLRKPPHNVRELMLGVILTRGITNKPIPQEK